MTDQHAPSGEPGGIAFGATTGSPFANADVEPAGRIESGDPDDERARTVRALYAERAALRADLAQRTAELQQATEHRTFLAAGWQNAQQQLDLTMKQRDAYLLDLQQQRAVVSAARAYVAWWDEPLRPRLTEAWQKRLRALESALDHSPAVGESQERL